MMLVTAIVAPAALGDVRAGLDELDAAGVTVSDASGADDQHGPAVRVELLVDDDAVETVVDAVVRAGGSGRVWVVPVDTVVRVRTGERGVDAL